MYINYLAVLVATVAGMVIGSVWYGPIFGSTWMRILGKRKEDLRQPGPAMLGMAIATLVMAYVLAHFVGYMNAATAWEGAQVALWIWLGFLATMFLSLVFFEGRPLKLFIINTANHLITLVVMGVILATWQ